MSLLEVKNNLLKFCYEEDLILSGFVKVTDLKNSYIAQVLHLEATRIGKVAIAKILFLYNNDEISSYNGSIPSLRAEVSAIDSSILLNTLEKTAPLNLGVIAQQNQKLFVDMSVLNDNPIICAEKFFATNVFLNNLAIQLQHNGKKVVVFDTVGVFKTNKLTLGKDFKLPLNTSAINHIYNNGFESATSDTKALIQSIFEELSEYSKTVPFIPFNTFKSVVDAEFNRTKLIQLILLKNTIKQIGDLNIYGEAESDFVRLTSKIQTENTIVIDISGVSESFQKECIKYVYSLLKTSREEFYTFLPLNNGNTDKEVLTTVYDVENIHTTIICGYDYTCLNLLKQKSKNMFMFTPLKQQKDFGGYNIFLQKLAEDEYIAYGKMTKFVPLIVKLHPIKTDEIIVSQPTKQETIANTETIEKVDNTMVENFVNSITPESINLVEETPEEELETEEVLETDTLPVESTEESVEESVEEEGDGEEFATLDEDEETVTEPETEEVQEITEEPIETLSNEPTEEETIEPVIQEEQQIATEAELTEALNEVPDIEDDEELSDDDLDMIEELSNPDEEVQSEDSAVVQEETPRQMAENIVEEEPVAPQPMAEEPVTPQTITEPEQTPVPQTEKPEVIPNTTNPTVPIYPTEIPEEDKISGVLLQQGDRVFHEEFGEGVVEKMINYGDKELCSINFANIGRRLLNPEITELRKL